MKNGKFLRTTMLLMLSLVIIGSVIGGTIAWFTDEVTSANNIVASGTLDMKVSFKPYGAENTTWTEVTEDTPVFNTEALYEPGYIEAVWLKIENVGNLAFRANAALQIISEKAGINQAGNSFELSDSLIVKSATVTDVAGWEAFYTTRESLNNYDFKPIALNSADLTFAKNMSLIPGASAEQYVLVVIEMPTTVGNEANHNGTAPEIVLGLKAVATQMPHEEDSFNNQYDANATYPEVDMVNGPKANVTPLDKDAENYPSVINYQWSPVQKDNCKPQQLDVAYLFQATETKEESLATEYGSWHADFVVYADKDVPAESLALAGQYSAYPWLGFANPETVNAGTEIRLLKDAAGLAVSYYEVCDFKDFYCGATAINTEALKGTTLTVELRLYEAPSGALETETGKHITVGTFKHTF